MAKIIVEDVVPPEKRSIRSVPISSNRKRPQERAQESGIDRITAHQVSRTSDSVSAPSSSSRPQMPRETSVQAESFPDYAASRKINVVEDDTPIPAEITRAQSSVENNVASSIAPRAAYEKDDAWREIDRELHEKPSRAPRYILWGVVVVCLAVLAIYVIGLWNSATVTITPKSEKGTISGSTLAGEVMSSSTISAFATSEAATTTSLEASMGGVPYQVVTLSENVSKSLPVTSTQNVSVKASGQITIYNSYSTSAQHLIATTRFATPSGQIYRINAPVTIPGAKGTTPGSVTVTVYADQPGASYNSGLTTFTLPGLQSNATEYKDVYAKSKTAMTGGASGLVSMASAVDIASAKQAIEAQLQSDLVKEVNDSLSNESDFYQNLSFVKYGIVNPAPVASTGAATTSVVYEESGTVNAIVFDKQALAAAVAAAALPDYDNGRVTIPEINQLSIALVTPASDTTPWLDNTINFTVRGNVTVIWTYPESDLLADLLGQPKSSLPQILSQFPTIETAEANIKPFWDSSFPKNAKNITITDTTLPASTNP